MSQSIFEQYEIFKTMHPVKIQVMKELSENMKGKQLKEAGPMIVAASTKLKQSGQSFSPEEIKVLLDILTKDMSPEEKAKVEMMKNIVRKRR